MDGKHRFLIRLAVQMRKDGVIIDNNKPDVHIYLPRGKRNKNAKINLLRVDGLIMNTRWNHKVKNRKIKESINKSNALIYQGSFCEQAYRKFLSDSPDEIILAGGGVHNQTLVRMLRQELNGIPILMMDELGMNSDAREAVSFAVLAYAAIKGYPNNVPSATGAAGPVILGKIIPA